MGFVVLRRFGVGRVSCTARCQQNNSKYYLTEVSCFLRHFVRLTKNLSLRSFNRAPFKFSFAVADLEQFPKFISLNPFSLILEGRKSRVMREEERENL
jgi:hypothetical protein